ncbi:MAG: TlpA disulfide reductase family protein [Holophaga sp.]|nr:TlpA disulfide reductase family protein [Holophaga sp.]
MKHLPTLAILLALPTLHAQTTAPKAEPVAAQVAAKPAPAGLKIGDPAPAFKASRWVKGTPVTALEKGKVYVVEFWATWCGPCRETIPHLTEMSKKVGDKAIFIGVDIWERGSDEVAIDKAVDAFVKEMGDKMAYNVCRDAADKHMATTWMKAAGRNGIPSAFIVDATGTVAWIGHPMMKMDIALDEILAGKYDIKAAAVAAEKEALGAKERQEKQMARQKALAEVMPGIQEALTAKDWAKVIPLVNAAEAKYPDLKDSLFRPRFLCLAHTDEAKALALAKSNMAIPNFGDYFNTANALLDAQAPRTYAPKALEIIEKAETLDAKLAPRILTLRFKALLRVDEVKAKALFEAEQAKPEKESHLYEFIYALVNEEGLAKPWLNRALTVLEANQKKPKASPVELELIAKAYFSLNRPKDAAAAQEKYVAFAKEQKAPESFLKRFEADLKKYQDAAK